VTPAALIPVPAKLTPRSGAFVLGATTSIVAADDLARYRPDDMMLTC